MYIGITNNLYKRIYQHKNKLIDGFTKKYNVTKLVYYESTENVISAITREKQLKNWVRKKKNNLVITINSEWKDLGADLI
jgi:putative endonuclease